MVQDAPSCPVGRIVTGGRCGVPFLYGVIAGVSGIVCGRILTLSVFIHPSECPAGLRLG